MAQEVVISVNDGKFGEWAKHFVARQPLRRRNVFIPSNPSPAQAKQVIIGAVSQAGAGGIVIFNVGHGATSTTGNPAEATCEIAPNSAFKLVGMNNDSGTVSVFYDVPHTAFGPSDLDHDLKNNARSPRLANWRMYAEIAAHFKSVQPLRVIFLTCNVGNSTDFVRKLANDWGVVVVAYKKRVVCTPIVTTSPGRPAVSQFYLHLESETVPFLTAETNIAAQEELPDRTGDSVRIGPPLKI